MADTDEVVRARGALSVLQKSIKALAVQYGDTLDRRRLELDVARLAEDLDALCGAAEPPSPPPAPDRLVIEDKEYAHDFWMDAEDEGLGASYRRT